MIASLKRHVPTIIFLILTFTVNNIHGILFKDPPPKENINNGEQQQQQRQQQQPAPHTTPNNLRSTSFHDPKSVELKQRDSSMCDGYDGILAIKNGDMYAATGTSFFLYVVNQLIYAERNNLIPWVHFTQPTSVIYDKNIHDAPFTTAAGKPVTFQSLLGLELTEIIGEGDEECRNRNNAVMAYPGPPDFEHSDLHQYNGIVGTSGVWEHYFEPVSAFRPKRMTAADAKSCASKPLMEMSQIMLYGVHNCAPWSVRAWVYPRLPVALGPNMNEPRAYQKWFEPMREIGHRIVSHYIHPQTWIIKRVNEVNPHPDNNDNNGGSSTTTLPCLAMHIRLTDKGANRQHIPLERYLPYARIYTSHGGSIIYLATDQRQILDRIVDEWPESISSRVRRQDDAYRSDSSEAIFHSLAMDRHRANTEALVDIYAMARCGFMIHGFSAISEAAIYISEGMDLHRYSVNLDDPEHVSEEEFEEMVKGRIVS